MDDKEKFGVELELITNSFKKKFDEVVKKTKDSSKQIKSQVLSGWTVGIDTKGAYEHLDQLKKKAEDLAKENKVDVKVDNNGIGATLEQYSKMSDEVVNKFTMLNSQIRDSSKELNESGTFFGKLGQKARNFSDELKSAWDSVDSIKEIKKNLKELQSDINVQAFDTLKSTMESLGNVKMSDSEFKNLLIQTEAYTDELKQAFEMKQKIKSIKLDDINLKVKDNVFSNIINKAKATGALIKQHLSDSFAGKTISKVKEFGAKVADIFTKAKPNISGFGDRISKAFSSGIGSIKRFAIGLLGIRTIMGFITQQAKEYISNNEQLQAQAQALSAGFQQLLAPVIERIVGLASRIMAYVGAIIKLITGVDILAKGMASVSKNTKSASKSAKEMKGSLSGLDEIINIASDSGDSGGGGDAGLPEAQFPEIDTAPLEKFINKAKELFAKIFEPFQKAWEKNKEGLISSFTGMVDSLAGLGKSVGESLLEVWTNGTGEEIISNILEGWQQIFDIVGGIADALQHAWDNAGNGTAIIQAISDIFIDIQEFALSIGDSIKKWVLSEEFQTALDRVVSFIKDIAEGIKNVCDWLLEMYNKYAKPIIDEKLLPMIDEVIIAISDVWNACKPVIDKIVDAIRKYVEPVIKDVCKALGGVIDIIRGIAQFVSGVFTGDWKKAWTGIKTIFKGIWDTLSGIVSGVFNAIWGAIKGVLNVIIGGFEGFINIVIKGLNKLLKPLRDLGNEVLKLVGAKVSIGNISTVSLPRLDVGTDYVPADMMAIIHKGEKIIPKKFNSEQYINQISNNQETNDLLRELIEVIEGKDTNFSVDGKELARVVRKYNNQHDRIMGRSY